MTRIETAPATQIEEVSATQPASPATSNSLREAVVRYLKQYFNQLIGAEAPPTNLYAQIMSEIEPPLLEMILRHNAYNQVKTAKQLAVSRGTLRKKMQKYGMLKWQESA